ncbi:cell wall hydrolase [Paucibacter sp. DJ1R-11]|uniref:cell wall hydrolase n=1 Tax=Paucibacter sp. DJ1R-11 TaxID=2893556 RepID=UPI0021E384BC|nr:cell wall hydrolase [Paucibacter sp. DJ1R-11]MCV2361961.1 cell wall hydrolase [Paucibacter sp. DJ1R-11]
MKAPEAAAGRAHAWLRPENLDHSVGQGTLTAVLRTIGVGSSRPVLFGLTAGHVLGGDPQAEFGDRVSLTSLDRDATVLYGRAHSWSPDLTRRDRRVRLDAGLLTLDEAALGLIADDLPWPLGWADARPGDEVRLLTRHHRLAGRVRARIDTDVEVGDPPIRYSLSDVLCCEIDRGSLPGDSGAPVWDLRQRLVGLLVGRAPEGSDGNAIVTPIDRVLAWSGCDLVLRGQALLAPDEGRAAPPEAPQVAAASSPQTQHDCDVMARTMWGEARGEPDARTGMAAVGHVVLNRCAARRWWGGTVDAVCLKAWQFSCWNDNDPNRPQLVVVTEADALFALAQQLSAELLAQPEPARLLNDPTHGATHYHAASLPRPAWARASGATECARIGHHIFYRNIA